MSNAENLETAAVKQYRWTAAGKAALFIGCLILTGLFALCFAAIVFFIDFGFYTSAEADIIAALRLPEGTWEQQAEALLHFGYTMRYAVFFIGAAAAVGAVICFVALMCASGRRKGAEGVHPGYLNRVPFDLLLAVSVLAVFLFCLLMSDLINDVFSRIYPMQAGMIAAVCIVIGCIFLGLCMSLAARIKQRTLIKNTVIYMVLRLLWRAVKAVCRGIKLIVSKMPLVWKTAAVLLVLLTADLVLAAGQDNEPVQVAAFVFLIIKLVLSGLALYAAVQMRTLQKGGRALAAGDLSHQTDTSRLMLDFKEHGENLNSIAEGMNRAVEERMKSEHMKTELITNVSHDLKTPLTSIINYAGLINSEETDNENIKEYSSVLMRQSERLKRLIEDLVEASKASAGVLDADPVPCDPAVFLEQAGGEYEDKLKAAGLELVVKQPDEKLQIMADGRRMWRVFDNLMNNVCKYAQSGTRVYLSMEKQGEDAVITLKNTSAAPLDIPADELMERFVRGDRSRSTEGNGLGLSIAQSMAELQGGTLKLDIDGDLFKAILSFPLVKGEEKKGEAQSPYSHINMIKYS